MSALQLQRLHFCRLLLQCVGLRQFLRHLATSMRKTELIGSRLFSSFDTERTTRGVADSSAAALPAAAVGAAAAARRRFSCGRSIVQRRVSASCTLVNSQREPVE